MLWTLMLWTVIFSPYQMTELSAIKDCDENCKKIVASRAFEQLGRGTWNVHFERGAPGNTIYKLNDWEYFKEFCI